MKRGRCRGLVHKTGEDYAEKTGREQPMMSRGVNSRKTIAFPSCPPSPLSPVSTPRHYRVRLDAASTSRPYLTGLLCLSKEGHREGEEREGMKYRSVGMCCICEAFAMRTYAYIYIHII